MGQIRHAKWQSQVRRLYGALWLRTIRSDGYVFVIWQTTHNGQTILMSEHIEKYMHLALAEAERAATLGEVPVGAVVVLDDVVIASAYNTRECDKDPLAHAEIKALRIAAQKIGDWRLDACALYVTLEPCPMCLGALFQARVGELYFGAFDEKRAAQNVSAERNALPSLQDRFGDTSHESPLRLTSNNHTLTILGGVLQTKCSALLKSFFKSRR